MKAKFYFLFLIFLPAFLFAQSPMPKIFYLDSLHREISSGDYKYYRVVKDYYLDQASYGFKEFYKSGKLFSEGTSTKKEAALKTGLYSEFYENGNKKFESNYVKGREAGFYTDYHSNGNKYSTGYYSDGLKLGNYSEWHDSGKLRVEGEYVIPDPKNRVSELKVKNYWNSENVQKVVDGNGEYDQIEDQIQAKGVLKNGKKDGVWSGLDKRNKITFTETYSNGKLISGKSIDENQLEREYKEILIQPEYLGGMQGFYSYIAKNFRAPTDDRFPGGRMLYTFIVDRDGSLVDIKNVRDIGFGTAEEGVRMLQNCGKWIPGKVRGVPVRILYTLPIAIGADRE